MIRRAGFSLTEVLVALFLVALGTISILALFPLGVIQMGQALKDDRTAQAAQQADAFMRWYWKVNVLENANDPSFVGGFGNTANVFWNPPGGGTPQPNFLPISAGMGPSYPVVVDPMGLLARGGMPDQFWLGRQSGNSNIARRNLQLISVSPNPTSQAFRTCSLMDGLGFAGNGVANVVVSPTTVDRDTRYNWLWVLQVAPDVSAINPQPLPHMTVVVFDKRAPLFAPPGAEQVFSPSAAGFGCFPPPFFGGTTQVASNSPTVVSFPLGAAPPVQKGGWLLDATVINLDVKGIPYVPPNPPTNPPTGPPPAVQPSSFIRNGNFYRVVSVTDNPSTNTTDIEFQTPMLPDSFNPNPSAALSVPIPPAMRQFIYLNGVSEVFQRPPLNSIP